MKKTDAQERTSAIQQFIKRLRDQNPEMSYDDAWLRAKKSPELKRVFDAMTPSSEDYRTPSSFPPKVPRLARQQSRLNLNTDKASDCIKHDPIYDA